MPRRLLPILALYLISGALSVGCMAEEGRVIVKYKASASTLRQAQKWNRTEHLAARLGLGLRAGRQIHSRTEVVHGKGWSSEALAARLAREPEVEYAVPDQLRTIRTLPNDPLLSGQWYLQTTEVAAIHATAAWNQTTGSRNVVVAVVDTGVRFDHPDLSAKLLPGYNFISDAANAGDGGGRDADASDPGDFISASNTIDPNFLAVCGYVPEQASSWHGTRVAGVVGATGNNSVGIAGTSFGVRILPVRVIGKCGGFDSDIMAGMRWAAGLPVPGVPDNPNPAKILNLSLGSHGSCTSAYLDTVAELTAHGALVVAPAGNETGPVDAPANCPGVLAVGGLRHIGTKVGYSSFGPEVSISAPAGNCLTITGHCPYSIQTTTNLGTTVPGENGYTDEINRNIGTSFSAPQVAGVAALMFSVNPTLTPADIIARIKQTSRAFPTDGTVPTCPNVSIADNSAGQCNCTTATCGAGILDAAAAVAAALPPNARLEIGWNLMGNSTDGEVDVASAFGDSAKVATVWKWLPGANAGWAFFAPSLANQGSTALQDYAASKGYQVLTAVSGGEGFWVDAKQAFEVTRPAGNAIVASYFQSRLVPGWNLISIGETRSATEFDVALGYNVTTLWAWDNVQNNWYFYSPSLQGQGGTTLADYIGSKGYLDFASTGKTLGNGQGFWVNTP